MDYLTPTVKPEGVNARVIGLDPVDGIIIDTGYGHMPLQREIDKAAHFGVEAFTDKQLRSIRAAVVDLMLLQELNTNEAKDDCGANAPGGDGFQKGNTCAAGGKGAKGEKSTEGSKGESGGDTSSSPRKPDGTKPIASIAEVSARVFDGKPSNPEGRDTYELYSTGKTPEGRPTFTDERRQLHERIIEEHFKGKTPVTDPQAFMTGGGPASGKGSAERLGFLDIPENVVKIDSDEIKKQIPEYTEIQSDDESWTRAAASVHEESSYLSKEIMRRAAEGSYNTFLDGTGDSSIESLRRKVDQIRKSAGKVQAIYVTADVDEAVRRSMERAAKTRRWVPESFLRACHASVSDVFPKALDADLFDKVALYDTNQKPPRLVLSKNSGEKFRIHDDDLWQDFLNKAKQ